MKPNITRIAGAALIALIVGACSSTGATETPAPTVAPTAAPTAMVLPATAVPTPTTEPTASETAAASATPAPAGLSGQWSGAWQDTSPDQSGGTFVVTWTQTGSVLAGSIMVKGTPCLTTGQVTGSLSGSSISFGAVSGRVTISYTGTVASDTMKGTYSAPTCGNAKGNWSATKG